MRLLWFSHFIPFPPRGGNLQRSFHLIREMSKSYEVSLVALNFLGDSPSKIGEYSKELGKVCETVDIWDLPYPWRGMRWRVELLGSPIFSDPVSCRTLCSRGLLARWKDKLVHDKASLLHFDTIDLGAYADAANGFRRVLNHHNCESQLAFRRAYGEPNVLKKAYLLLEAKKLARLEESLCGSFDVNTVVSQGDSGLLRRNSPGAHFHIVENGVDVHYFKPTATSEEPATLIFTGSLDWGPNLSAVQFLTQEIWPLVKQAYPRAQLILAGKNPAPSVQRWADIDPNIKVFANPADMRPLLNRATISVCPILEGGGTRLKILDAMAMAKPTVSTSIGCEGLKVSHGENILLADSPRDFAGEVSHLLESECLREKLGHAARALVQREYAWENIGVQLRQAYRCALDPETCDQRLGERSNDGKARPTNMTSRSLRYDVGSQSGCDQK
jgi:glycosyltransferase involved in cell wall biosynthesis